MTKPQEKRRLNAKERLEARLLCSQSKVNELVKAKLKIDPEIEMDIVRMKKELTNIDFYLKGGIKKQKVKK